MFLPAWFVPLTFSLLSWCSTYLILYATVQVIKVTFFLVWKCCLPYIFKRRRAQEDRESFVGKPTPKITVQLDLTPNLNEKFIQTKMTRLLRSVSELNYPLDLLQIQIIHNSMSMDIDFTREILNIFPKASSNQPMIEHITCNAFAVSETGDDIHSSDLRNQALRDSNGEFIAIFTLDHFPSDKNFLNRIIPHFSDAKVAAVQPKMKSCNWDETLLTSLQSIDLIIKQECEDPIRDEFGFCLLFDGIGVWRKTCIEDSILGGWHSNTDDEGVDLSLRAQSLGWKLIYEKNSILFTELPPTWDVFSFRLSKKAKGCAQLVRKHFSNLWKSDLRLINKCVTTISMLEYLQYLPLFILFFLPLILLPSTTIL